MLCSVFVYCPHDGLIYRLLNHNGMPFAIIKEGVNADFIVPDTTHSLHCKILMVILTKHLVTRVTTNIDNGYYCH